MQHNYLDFLFFIRYNHSNWDVSWWGGDYQLHSIQVKTSAVIFAILHLCFCLLFLQPDSASANKANEEETIQVKVAILHLAPSLGELNKNIAMLEEYAGEAVRNGAQIVVAPELATTGYFITEGAALKGLGMRAPFPKLDRIRNLAISYRAYIVVGIAEIGDEGGVYNSAVLFKPDGNFFVERKRGKALWNGRGNVPFSIVETPFGELGIVICSDTYLMDWIRILTLKGADIILSPANWWGKVHQEEIWATRAHENGVYMVVANRWGEEQYEQEKYSMNDAPSAVIAPTGQVALHFTADSIPNPENQVLYYTIDLPKSRINSNQNQSWAVTNREPLAYGDLANAFYRPDLGNRPIPDLPRPGITTVDIMSYRPQKDARANLKFINSHLDGQSKPLEVLLLPSYGVSAEPVRTQENGWETKYPWSALRELAERRNIKLLVTSIRELSDEGKFSRQSLLLMRKGKATIHRPLISTWQSEMGEVQSPLFLDLDHARIGVVLDRDVLTPETSADLAKMGADIVLVPSTMDSKFAEGSPNSPNVWSKEDLIAMWETRTNDSFHLAVSSGSGAGIIVRVNDGFIDTVVKTDADAHIYSQTLELDSSFVRHKFLNAYFDFDLESLIGRKPDGHMQKQSFRMLIAPMQNEERQILPPRLRYYDKMRP